MGQKRRTPRNPKYLEWIRSRRCCVTGSAGPNIAHHVRMDAGAGMGQKPSDYRTVPLHPVNHANLHNTGERTFWSNVHADPVKVICFNLLEYLFEKGFGEDVYTELESIMEEKDSEHFLETSIDETF